MHPIFQSPLHRGNHFNRGDIFTGMSKTLNFSPLFIGEITSTTGRKYWSKSWRCNFSPLFIGEITSTIHRSIYRWYLSVEFQSPLHRGNHFNLVATRGAFCSMVNFSPLFIGEITSTSTTAPANPSD